MIQDPGDEPSNPGADAVADPEASEAAATPAAPLPVVAPEGSPDEQLQRRAQLAEHRLGEVLNAYRQAKQENEGFRERVTRDVQRQFERHNQKLLLRFIEVLDNLDRALEAGEQTYTGNAIVDGLILVRTQLLRILQKEGLERVQVLGLAFDPTFSEAVGTQVVSDPDHDKVVVKELQRGYRLHGRLVRAARVLVGVYQQPAAQAEHDVEVGVDGLAPAQDAEPEGAAETLRLDETMLRDIFGVRSRPKKG